jgi:hypothetical protein
LLPWSEQFDNGAWAKGVGVTVTANAETAPNGTNTADNITFSAGGAAQFVRGFATLTVGVAYTVSVFARLVSGTPTFTFDVGNGASASTAQTPTALWQRFFFTFTFSGANQWVDFEASAAGTIAFWGAQLEPVTYQTAPGPYVATTASAYYGPRFDHDPVTLAPRGLLIEEARTNLQTYSADFTNAVWVKNNITVTAAAAVSPDGTSNAQKIEATTSAATLLRCPTTAVASTAATFSVYAKQGTGATTANAFLLRNNTTATNLVGGTLNYSTGVWTYTTGSTGVTVVDAGNGWWRVQIAAASGITSGDSLIGYVGFIGNPQTAADHLFAWGAQLELGAFATSYIPTVASQVTRNTDVAAMTGTNFSGWYNQTEGTFVVGASQPVATGGNSRAISANNGTVNESIQIAITSTGTVGYGEVRTGGVAVVSATNGVISVGNPANMAFAAAVNNAALSTNGAAPTTDTSLTMPAVDRLNIGAHAGGLSVFNGHIRQISYYNARLPNAQLQTLTAPSLEPSLALDFMSGFYSVG